MTSSSFAWGNARDALSAVHNLETLVKSPRVKRELVTAVFPEILERCAALRAAFAVAPDGARAQLRAYANARVDELEAAVHEAESRSLDTRARLRLEQEITRLGQELDAATELLELAERAEHAAPTEHSARELARVAVTLAAAIRPHGTVGVRLDVTQQDCTLVSDAHVLTRLLVHAASWVHAFGASAIALRPKCDATHVRFTIEPATPADAALPLSPMATLHRIAPTDAVVLAAVRAMGARVEADGGRGVLSLPRAG